MHKEYLKLCAESVLSAELYATGITVNEDGQRKYKHKIIQNFARPSSFVKAAEALDEYFDTPTQASLSRCMYIRLAETVRICASQRAQTLSNNDFLTFIFEIFGRRAQSPDEKES